MSGARRHNVSGEPRSTPDHRDVDATVLTTMSSLNDGTRKLRRRRPFSDQISR